MEPIDWKRKLTSRKFWLALCNLITDIFVLFGGAEDVAVKVTAMVMAGGTMIAYIIGEGLVDASNKEPIVVNLPINSDPPDEEEA